MSIKTRLLIALLSAVVLPLAIIAILVTYKVRDQVFNNFVERAGALLWLLMKCVHWPDVRRNPPKKLTALFFRLSAAQKMFRKNCPAVWSLLMRQRRQHCRPAMCLNKSAAQ